MPKQLNVKVMTMDAEMEYAIFSSTTGKELFDQVAKTIGLREVWYFGLQYIDSKGLPAWVKLNKKLLSQDMKKDDQLPFLFRAKFFPEDVCTELIQEITQRLFYLQVKEAILNDEIYCPPETSVLLASYALQVKNGDYTPELRTTGFLASERFLPRRVIDQHKLSEKEWEDRIISWYTEHQGMARDEAVIEYLKVAQDLEMYGVSYFEITNRKGTPLWLGVDALGLNIYEKSDKLIPKIGFPWSEIQNISFNQKKFIIKPNDKKAPEFIFFTTRLRINKRILALCMGNHELYIRRRQPDSLELQQMKTQAAEEKKAREAERLQLLKERKQKEENERQREELEKCLHVYQSEFTGACSALEKSKEITVDLAEKWRQVEEQRHELLEAHQKSEETRQAVQRSASLGIGHHELQRKEQEAAEAKSHLIRKMSEASLKAAESMRLQKQLHKARLEMEENRQALLQTMNSASSFKSLDSLENSGRESPTSDGASTPVGELVTPSEKNKRLNEQLKMLSADLSAAKDQTRLTRNDILHTHNLSHGRDKYQILKQIQQGNTRERVDIFESM